MLYLGCHILNLCMDDTLYGIPASRLMLLLNQHALSETGGEKMMTLADKEKIEWQKRKSKLG